MSKTKIEKPVKAKLEIKNKPKQSLSKEQRQTRGRGQKTVTPKILYKRDKRFTATLDKTVSRLENVIRELEKY